MLIVLYRPTKIRGGMGRGLLRRGGMTGNILTGPCYRDRRAYIGMSGDHNPTNDTYQLVEQDMKAVIG